MLRTKKSENSFNVSTLNCSVISETPTETMERQIDNYTRRLEQDKRKFFRAQENFSEIKKDNEVKNKELEELKSKKFKTQMNALKCKITSLESTLDQTINSYNEDLAKNNRLKCEIDELRKDRKSESEKLKFLVSRVSSVGEDIERKRQTIESKKAHIQEMKGQIIKVRETNESQLKAYEQDVENIRDSFHQTGREGEKKGKEERSGKAEAIDTQPVVKLRLRNLIAKNKEKVKIIEQYKKSMSLIHQNFQEIQEESGIQSLEEITKTFLKHEEQNLFVYQYSSRLGAGIEDLKEGNAEVRQKIQQQQELNRATRAQFSGTPEEERKKRDLESFRRGKFEPINQLRETFVKVGPKIESVLKAYGVVPGDESIELSLNNVEGYLSELENLIAKCAVTSDPLYRSEFKEAVTRYTKLPPPLSEEVKEKAEEKLLDQSKLAEIAGEFWEKRKGSK